MHTETKELIQTTLNQKLLAGDLSDIFLVFRISGGLPHQRYFEECKLSGTGDITITHEDILHAVPKLSVTSKLAKKEVLALLQDLHLALIDFPYPQEVKFLPDSVIGSFTIQLESSTLIVYFPVDSDLQPIEDASSPASMKDMIIKIRSIEQALLQREI
ncbi:MAG: hypothetical protein ACFFDW_11780 [Candidatus Thorarchaeota archaeon]